MKKIVSFLLLFVLIFGVGAGAVFAMTSAVAIPEPVARIQSVSGEVNIRTGNGAWQRAETGFVLASGQMIKAGKDGSVTMVFYDNSSASLGADSELRLAELFLDKNDHAVNKIRMKLEFGRIWARVIQFSDQESFLEVQSKTAVATVRGSGFDFFEPLAGAAEIIATKGVIEVGIPSQSRGTKLLKQGFKAIPQGTSTVAVRPASKAELESKWFKGNEENDRQVEKEIIERIRQVNQANAGALPGSPWYDFKLAAEKLRLAAALDGQRETELRQRFAERRLMEAAELAMSGAKENSSAVLAGLSQGASAEGNLGNIKDLEKKLFMSLAGDASNKGLLDQFNEFDQASEADQAKKGYLRARLLELKLENLANMSEAERTQLLKEFEALSPAEMNAILREKIMELLGDKNLDLLNEYLPGAIDQMFASTTQKAGLPPPSVEKLIESMPALKLPAPLPSKVAPLPQATAEPAPIEAPQKASATTTTVPVAEKIIVKPKLLRLSVVSPRLNIAAGERVQLKATAIYDDGSTKDVTAQASWSLSGDLGAVDSGGLVVSNQAGGSGQATANLTEGGITVADTSGIITALPTAGM